MNIYQIQVPTFIDTGTSAAQTPCPKTSMIERGAHNFSKRHLIRAIRLA